MFPYPCITHTGFALKKNRKLITTGLLIQHVYFYSYWQGFFQIAHSCITYSTTEKYEVMGVVVISVDDSFHTLTPF